MNDLRYALRQIRTNPGFALIAVLPLALGVGANTALFSVVNTLLLRDLPYKDAAKLVYVTEFWPHEPIVPGPPSPDYETWRKNAKLVDGIAAYGGTIAALNITGRGDPVRAQGTVVTAQFLDLIGTELALGRNFTPQEDSAAGTPAVILGHKLWEQRFRGAADVIGKSLQLDGIDRAIVGVLPRDFVFPDNNFRDELLIPMALPPDPNWHDSKNFRFLRVIARLKPGVSPTQFRSELSGLIGSTAHEEPPQMITMRKDMEIRVTTLRDWLSGDVRLIVVILQAAVLMVLLIGCANVANLQIARSIGRAKEMAVRAAMGAGRARLVRQLLTESLLYSSFGGGAGLLFGYLGIGSLRAFLPANLHLADRIQIDRTDLVFTFSLAVFAGLFTGLAPVLAIWRTELIETLKAGNAKISAGRNRLHGALVIAEVSLAIVLLSASGLLIRNFLCLTALDLGFDSNNVLTMRIALPRGRYPTPESLKNFYTQLVGRAAAIPGVRAAAVSTGLPLVGTHASAGTGFEGRPAPLGGRPTMPVALVSADYFRVLAIPILRGRAFTDDDRTNGPRVAMINQAFAEKFFPGEDALGKRIEVGSNNGSWREIVGIVGDVKQQGARRYDPYVTYVPFEQGQDWEMILVLKSSVAGLVAAATKAVQALDPNQPVYDIATMEQRLSDSLSTQRANMQLMAIFATLAFTLAAVGIFSVLAYFVSRRSHEIGVRMALGARPQDVLSMVLRHGMTLTGVGIVVGLLGSLASTRALRALLTGVTANDPLTFTTVPVVFAIVAAAACYIPARRASQVDPTVSLRHE